MRIIFFVGFILFSSIFSLTQENNKFHSKIKSYLTDTTNFGQEYPKMIQIPDYLIEKCEKEFRDDSVTRYFLQLSRENFRHILSYDVALTYLLKKDYTYSILALVIHWNPDVRVYTIRKLNEQFNVRSLINSVKVKNGERLREDKTAVRFLTDVLEHTPLFINGSENATIHDMYINEICWYLDKLCHQNHTQSKSVSGWYKNEKNFQAAINGWKSFYLE